MTNSLKLDSQVTFLQAADGDAAAGPKRFRIVAYTGSPIRQGWSREPVVIDVAGMKLPKSVPVVIGHDYSLGSILGQGVPSVVDGQLVLEGEILADTETARHVVGLIANQATKVRLRVVCEMLVRVENECPGVHRLTEVIVAHPVVEGHRVNPHNPATGGHRHLGGSVRAGHVDDDSLVQPGGARQEAGQFFCRVTGVDDQRNPVVGAHTESSSEPSTVNRPRHLAKNNSRETLSRA
jgi:hypothetical protein